MDSTDESRHGVKRRRLVVGLLLLVILLALVFLVIRDTAWYSENTGVIREQMTLAIHIPGEGGGSFLPLVTFNSRITATAVGDYLSTSTPNAPEPVWRRLGTVVGGVVFGARFTAGGMPSILWDEYFQMLRTHYGERLDEDGFLWLVLECLKVRRSAPIDVLLTRRICEEVDKKSTQQEKIEFLRKKLTEVEDFE